MSKIGEISAIDYLALLCLVLVTWLLCYQTRLQSEISLEANELNNTKYANQSFLIFNRVPKAGSETLWSLIDKLAKRNNFQRYGTPCPAYSRYLENLN